MILVGMPEWGRVQSLASTVGGSYFTRPARGFATGFAERLFKI